MSPAISMAQLEEDYNSNSYFAKMNNTLNLRLDLDNDVRSFEYEGVDDNYSIEPNTNLRLGVAINYRFISLKIGFSPKFLQADDTSLKGKTKMLTLPEENLPEVKAALKRYEKAKAKLEAEALAGIEQMRKEIRKQKKTSKTRKR